ncbi:MAG: toxin-antitoxin system HicB family antitoxin [Galactobacillus timonensis]|uniref:type II toxin-antitoxin system HicB family antitoxin n=1 Tax=Galactobacillus timonensis TaxID=2041840 RepID=UPI0023F26F43|nr:toxin-antitoxin system HicB family antitoxin [Galactobacillus timonensis]MCI6066720.1 toxin-antitoxin system HicB family antitoxin [Galactobacillus timonensis]MCI6753468.1 toxin-antitoxin system HicB family antitoxin [Galactobacillus timonensis]
MKTIDYYLNLPYRLEIIPDPDEGGYVARYPDLPGCITVGETLESVVNSARDAKKAWLEAALTDGIDVAEPSSTDEYSGQFKLRLPKSLHRSLAEHSKQEGVSMNQYCVYLLSKNDEQEKIRYSH